MKDFELAQSKLAIKIKEKGKDKPQNESKAKFESDKIALEFRRKPDHEVAKDVEIAFQAMKHLIEQPIIPDKRQTNFENNLYLKQLAKATTKQNLEFIRMNTVDKC